MEYTVLRLLLLLLRRIRLESTVASFKLARVSSGALALSKGQNR